MNLTEEKSSKAELTASTSVLTAGLSSDLKEEEANSTLHAQDVNTR